MLATTSRSRGGTQPITAFAADLGFPEDFALRTPDEVEPSAAAAIAWLNTQRPMTQNFWPGLTLAFIAQAEAVLSDLGEQSVVDAFEDPRVKVKEGTAAKAVDQLTFLTPALIDRPLRRSYNFAVRAITIDMRRYHPSMPGHATSKWRVYKELIKYIFATTPAGRAAIAGHIWNTGVLAASETLIGSGRTRQPRPFLEVLESLSTSSGTTGGAMYQAMVYAYMSADSPTLNVQSQKVNVGSSRAETLGDVSGYLGEYPVLAAEAKDKDLTVADEQDLSAFVEDASTFPDLDAVVFARTFDTGIASYLEDNNVRRVDKAQMLATVRLWDVPKQDNAIRAMRFFLGRIQKDPKLLKRLTDFVDEAGASTPP